MHKLLLLELNCRNDPCDFPTIWHECMGLNLELAPTERATALLLVFNDKDTSIEHFAEWLEEPTGMEFDDSPLFIIWDNRGIDKPTRCVQEYSPMRDGVRQLVKEYHPQ